jgi:hypothetical protein
MVSQMSRPRLIALATVLTFLAIGSLTGAYYLNTAIVSQQQTISALQSTVSSLASHPATTTSTTTSTVSFTATRFPYIPWDTSKFPVFYIRNSSGAGSGGAVSLTSDLREAFLFTCVKEAASSQGCTVQVNSTNPLVYFQVTVRYPYANASQIAGAPQGANCAISSPTDHPDNRIPTYCMPIGSRGFVVTWEGAPT